MQEDRHQPRSRSPGCQQVRPQLGEFLMESARPHESHPRGDEAPSQLNIEQEQHLHQVGKAEFAEEIRVLRGMEPPRWTEASCLQPTRSQDLAPSDQPSPLLRSFQADEFGDLAREERRARHSERVAPPAPGSRMRVAVEHDLRTVRDLHLQ